jgi:prepilin-type N-terminal cleavage/methylation domain-containing protein
MSHRHVRTSRGFTLIELMMVVAIIGILSSVAYPALANATLRSRSTERTYMMAAIKSAIEDVYRLNDRFRPAGTPAGSPLGNYNPVLPYNQGKRYFDANQGSWTILTRYLAIEGATYFSYRFDGWESGAPGCWVEASGDLDGDGIPYVEQTTFLRVTGSYIAGTPVIPNPATF